MKREDYKNFIEDYREKKLKYRKIFHLKKIRKILRLRYYILNIDTVICQIARVLDKTYFEENIPHLYCILFLCLFVGLFFTCWIRVPLLFFFVLPWIRIHMTMHWRIGTVVEWGKLCIHMYMHLVVDMMDMTLDMQSRFAMNMWTCCFDLAMPIFLPWFDIYMFLHWM